MISRKVLLVKWLGLQVEVEVSIFVCWILFCSIIFSELPPEITLNPPGETHSIPPLSDITVKCTATGVPAPFVKWVLEDGRQVGPVLQLAHLKTDTTATCTAENTVGKAQAVLQILIAGKS
jgi:hypothetical protein